MASTNFTSTDPLTIKAWGKKAFADGVKPTLFNKLRGKSDTACVQVKDELQKAPGDNVRFRLRNLPTGKGVEGTEVAKGKGEGLVYSNFALGIDEKRYPAAVRLGVQQQRVNFDLQQDLKNQISDWLQDYIDTTFIEYLAGVPLGAGGTSAYHNTTSFAGNAITALEQSRIVYPGATATSSATVAATDLFDLTTIDKAIERSKLVSPTMRPADFDGEKAYVCILHPSQVTALRTNTATGQWLDIQKAAMTGGKVKESPIWGTDYLGMYNGTILLQNARIPRFSNYGAGANVQAARALFLGAQAGCVAYGKDTDEDGMLYMTEEVDDHKAHVEWCATLLWGMQRTIVNGGRYTNQTYGAFAIDTAVRVA